LLVAVISDTHLRRPTPWFEHVFQEHLAGADVLLHCGDSTGYPVWEYLSAMHPAFHAVAGNSDEYALGAALKPWVALDLEGLRLGLVHGWGDRPGAPGRVAEAFAGYDLVCHGHTHRRHFGPVQGVLLLNPGSLSPGSGASLALLTLARGRVPVCRFVDVSG
jgi:putative phosphoesterase